MTFDKPGSELSNYYLCAFECIDGKLHIILQTSDLNTYHIIVNCKTYQYHIQHRFDHFNREPPIKLIHAPLRNTLYLLTDSKAFVYSLDGAKWTKLKLKYSLSSCEFHKFGLVMSNDNRYIIIMSGYIYLLDLETMETWRSLKLTDCNRNSIKLGRISKRKDIGLMYGFTREIWKNEYLSQYKFPPDDVLRMILTFYQEDELIHFFDE